MVSSYMKANGSNRQDIRQKYSLSSRDECWDYWSVRHRIVIL